MRRRAGKRECRARTAICRRRVHALFRRLRACQIASHHTSQGRGCGFADLGIGRQCDGSRSRQARFGGRAEAGCFPAHQARTALPAGIVSRCLWVRASLPAVVATWSQNMTSTRHGSFSIAVAGWENRHTESSQRVRGCSRTICRRVAGAGRGTVCDVKSCAYGPMRCSNADRGSEGLGRSQHVHSPHNLQDGTRI